MNNDDSIQPPKDSDILQPTSNLATEQIKSNDDSGTSMETDADEDAKVITPTQKHYKKNPQN